MLARPASRITVTRRSHFCCTRSNSTSSSSGSPPPPPPPRPSYFSRQTLYPFLLLSTITSLALNLSHSRSQRLAETSHLSAQITVLEALLVRLRQGEGGRTWFQLSEEEREEVERELELVGLGRGKGVKREVEQEGETSWGEVLFGKKGSLYQPEKDDTDWEKVFKEADEAEKHRQASPAVAAETAVTPAAVPRPPAPARAAPTPAAARPRPPPSSSSSSGIYL